MFSYEHLASFCAAVEAGSYSGAARLLNKDRTTIREQIKMLEDNYAMQLFEIVGKKAIVTPAGQEIYQQARLLVKNSELLNNRMMNSYRSEIQSIDIYHETLVPASLIIAIEAACQQKMPHVKLHWKHKLRDDTLPYFNTGKHQLAIMQNRFKAESDFPIGFLNLGLVPIKFYCNPSHPFANRQDISVRDMQIEKQYISENQFTSLPELFCVSTDISVVSNNDILVELLKYRGWGTVCNEFAQQYVDRGELATFDIDELVNRFRATFALYYPMEMSSSKELKIIQDVTRDYSEKYFG